MHAAQPYLYRMDQRQSNFDPEVKQHFRKIMNSMGYTLLWLMSMVTFGLFFHLAAIHSPIAWYNILFYVIMLATLVLLVRYLFRTWSVD